MLKWAIFIVFTFMPAIFVKDTHATYRYVWAGACLMALTTTAAIWQANKAGRVEIDITQPRYTVGPFQRRYKGYLAWALISFHALAMFLATLATYEASDILKPAFTTIEEIGKALFPVVDGITTEMPFQPEKLKLLRIENTIYILYFISICFPMTIYTYLKPEEEAKLEYSEIDSYLKLRRRGASELAIALYPFIALIWLISGFEGWMELSNFDPSSSTSRRGCSWIARCFLNGDDLAIVFGAFINSMSFIVLALPATWMKRLKITGSIIPS